MATMAPQGALSEVWNHNRKPERAFVFIPLFHQRLATEFRVFLITGVYVIGRSSECSVRIPCYVYIFGS